MRIWGQQTNKRGDPFASLLFVEFLVTYIYIVTRQPFHPCHIYIIPWPDCLPSLYAMDEWRVFGQGWFVTSCGEIYKSTRWMAHGQTQRLSAIALHSFATSRYGCLQE